MTIFRWIVGGLFLLLALGALGSFGLYMAFDGELWLVRARRVRRWLWLVTLLWFNTEIWGQVVYTLWHWK
ncbi:MAG: hypothetical protein M3Z16_01760 [Pseudomonadota bacterium]|nr:hypothetical protein [Pseudomonadota bacterium]